jgi:hypothetical protein
VERERITRKRGGLVGLCCDWLTSSSASLWLVVFAAVLVSPGLACTGTGDSGRACRGCWSGAATHLSRLMLSHACSRPPVQTRPTVPAMEGATVPLQAALRSTARMTMLPSPPRKRREMRTSSPATCRTKSEPQTRLHRAGQARRRTTSAPEASPKPASFRRFR